MDVDTASDEKQASTNDERSMDVDSEPATKFTRNRNSKTKKTHRITKSRLRRKQLNSVTFKPRMKQKSSKKASK